MATQSHPVMRAARFGLLSWLISFVAGFALFPVKKLNAPLFTTLMYLVVLVTAGALLRWYFSKRVVSAREATLVGVLWLAMNLLLDFPMFAFGPMKMTVVGYYSEIGYVYLTFPVFGLLAARLAHSNEAQMQ